MRLIDLVAPQESDGWENGYNFPRYLWNPKKKVKKMTIEALYDTSWLGLWRKGQCEGDKPVNIASRVYMQVQPTLDVDVRNTSSDMRCPFLRYQITIG